jgi:hypothetical protein
MRDYTPMTSNGLLLDILTLTSCLSPKPEGVEINREVLRIIKLVVAEKKERIILGRSQCRKHLESLMKLLSDRSVYTVIRLLVDKSREICLRCYDEEVNGKYHEDEYKELQCLALKYLKDCRIDKVLTCEGEYSIVNEDLIKGLKRYSVELEPRIADEGKGAKVIMYLKSKGM